MEIIITGDYAKGIDSGTIEVFLVGENLNFDYTSQLENKIEKLINRKVNFYLAAKRPSIKDSLILYSK